MKKMLPIFSISMFLLLSQQLCHAYEFNGLNINGFISQGYLKTDNNDFLADTKGGTFDYNEVGLNFGAQVNDSIRIGVQILSRNLGEDGNNEFTFGYALGDYQHSQYFGLRAGKVRIPLGLYNQTRDVDMLRTGVFLPNAVYHDEYYTFFSALYGASIYGEIPLSVVGSLEYELFAGRADEDDDSQLMKNTVIALENTLAAYGSVATSWNMSSDAAYGGALRWNTPLDGLRVGYSTLFIDTLLHFDMTVVGTAEIDARIKPLHVLSAEYTWDDFVISSEWMRMRRFNDILIGGALAGTENVTAEGWYLNAAYRLNDLFEFGVGYSAHYDDKNNKSGEGFSSNFIAWRKDLTLSTRFDITDNWIVKAEYHILDGTAWLPNAGLYSDANSDENIKKKWNMIALKTTFSF